jgi:hypothetical protein
VSFTVAVALGFRSDGERGPRPGPGGVDALPGAGVGIVGGSLAPAVTARFYPDES